MLNKRLLMMMIMVVLHHLRIYTTDLGGTPPERQVNTLKQISDRPTKSHTDSVSLVGVASPGRDPSGESTDSGPIFLDR